MESPGVMEVDGAPATTATLRHLALLNYGHSTAMQVRGGAVRGLSLHLDRMQAATRELFGVALDPELIRTRIRAALNKSSSDATVKVYVFEQCAKGSAEGVSTLVVAEAPSWPTELPRSLRSTRYERPVAHLKHIGTFGKLYRERIAKAEGYDTVLLIGADGMVLECATANIGFFDGCGVVWPEGPALSGITMRLLEQRLRHQGIPSRRTSIPLTQVHEFTGAFTVNSRGLIPVGRIDERPVPLNALTIASLKEVHDALPWDVI